MRKIVLAFLGFVVCPILAYAGGLATELGEAVIGDLQIGSSYNLTEVAGLPLVVINTGENEVELRIEPVLEKETKEGYEPIPELSWITISKDKFYLLPQERAVSDIIISIPNDENLLGKRYQVNIWSHTVGEAGRVSLGLSSRLLLRIAEKEKPIPEKSEGINLLLLPESIELNWVKPGYVYDAKKEKKVSFIVENRSLVPVECILETLKPSESYALLEEGYLDPPNPAYLILSERKLVLKGYEKKEVCLFAAFPKMKEYGKKNYMFVVHLKGLSIPLGVYSKVYVKTK